LHDPVSMSTNGAGAVDQATINTAPQTASF
jgi:hypothetical protein